MPSNCLCLAPRLRLSHDAMGVYKLKVFSLQSSWVTMTDCSRPPESAVPPSMLIEGRNLLAWQVKCYSTVRVFTDSAEIGTLIAEGNISESTSASLDPSRA